MEQKHKSRIGTGIFLILVGAFFLAVQLYPPLRTWMGNAMAWPMIIVGVGGLLLVIGLLTGTPSMAVPACIVGGIGGILAYQNATGNWGSWAYIWTLIPGFVGIGTFLTGILGENTRANIRHGLDLILTSMILFAIFGSFLGGFRFLGDYWPLILIGAGIIILIRNLVQRKI
ncbi:MAG: hypothetical protein ABFD44_15540 [Anaerolineaceae bacterium]